MSGYKTRFINEKQLPLVVEPANPDITFEDFLALLERDNASFKEQILKYGGILFRNFPIDTVDHFNRFIETLNTGQLVDYIGGGSPRDKIKGKVYTSTEAPPAIKIGLHNEMSFVKHYPRHIYFYCDIPPEEGGETFIGDARRIYKGVDPKLREKFQEKGLSYVSRYYYKSRFMDLMNKIQRGHKTWIDVFETDSKSEVERKCRENEFELKWNKNDWVEIARKRPATIKHPETGEDIWFNQVHLFDYNPRFIGWWRSMAVKLFYFQKHMKVDEVFYGDKSPISREEIYHVMDVLDEESIYYPWQKGDAIVLDNVLAMHGRAPFKGKRRILTAMTK